MSKVVSINGDEALSERGQNDDLVEKLEELLQKARDGEIVGICAALQYSDRSSGTAMAGFKWPMVMVGCLTMMAHRICNDD